MSIKPLITRFPCIVPLVFDDSLSYIEFLGQVQVKLNQVIEQVNNIQTDLQEQIDDSIDAYRIEVNSQLESLRQYVDDSNATLDASLREYIDSQVNALIVSFNTFTVNVNATILDMQNRLNAIQETINSNLAYVIAYVDAENLEQNSNAQAEYDRIYSSINQISRTFPPVFNPTTGTYIDVETTILDMYSSFRYFAFTCNEFDNSGITCNEYDNKGITAINLDLFGKLYFGFFEKLSEMVNPYTGLNDSVKNVVNTTANKTSSYVITATQYDNLVLTANSYDSLGVKAYDYDFYAVNLLSSELPVYLGIWQNGNNFYSISGNATISNQHTEINVNVPDGADIISMIAEIEVNSVWYSLNGEVGEYSYSEGVLSINLASVPSTSHQARFTLTYNN